MRATRPWSVVLGALLYANVAHGAMLYMNWEDTDGATLALSEGETTRLVVSVELFEGEMLSGFGFSNSPIEGDPVTQIEYTVEPAGWAMLSGGSVTPSDLNTVLGRASQGAAGYTNLLMGPMLSGPGVFTLSYQTIQLTDVEDGSDLPITFNVSGTPGGSWGYFPALIDEQGYDLTWDANYAATYPGFAAFGEYGNAGWQNTMGSGQPGATPLILQRQVPEPASVVLLALGGLMLTRRKRA